MSKVVFLDRDGVINKERADYVKDWSEFSFLPDAVPGIRRLNQSGYRVVIISNQSAVNRGLIDRDALEDIHKRMVLRMEEKGGRIQAIYYCPHRPDENCDCRKPKPGLFFQAQRDLRIDLSACFFVGDKRTDVEAGKAAGLKTILIASGREDGSLSKEEVGFIQPSFVARNLGEAVDIILNFNEIA